MLGPVEHAFSANSTVVFGSALGRQWNSPHCSIAAASRGEHPPVAIWLLQFYGMACDTFWLLHQPNGTWWLTYEMNENPPQGHTRRDSMATFWATFFQGPLPSLPGRLYLAGCVCVLRVVPLKSPTPCTVLSHIAHSFSSLPATLRPPWPDLICLPLPANSFP